MAQPVVVHPQDLAAVSSVAAVAPGEDADSLLLRRLGYKQELKRALSSMSNLALCFAVMGILVGVTAVYTIGLTYGGPFSMTVGWLVAAPFNMCVALAMAEICSAFPTSGGLYYWSARTAGPRWSPLASWYTGWFNLVGMWLVFGTGCFALAQMIQSIVQLSTGGANGGFVISKGGFVGINAFICLSIAVFNTLSISRLSFLAHLTAIWNTIGLIGLTILLPVVATTRASPQFIFTYFNMDNGTGITDKFYTFVLALLVPQFAIIGFDASAHMTEETKNAAYSGPIGIVGSVGLSIILGWGYAVALSSTVTDIGYLLDPSNDASGYAVAQLFYSVFKQRFGSGLGGIICFGYVAVFMYLSLITTLTPVSRMSYAFARDRALPLSKFWYRLNKEEIPVNTVWLSAFAIFCVTLTSLGSQVAFIVLATSGVIVLFVSYALPIFFRLTTGRRTFVAGPFNLGRLGTVVGWIAIIWVLALVAFGSLPLVSIVTADTFNYTPVVLGGLIVLTTAGWLLSGRHWFQGPVRYVVDGQ